MRWIERYDNETRHNVQFLRFRASEHEHAVSSAEYTYRPGEVYGRRAHSLAALRLRLIAAIIEAGS